MSDGQGLELRLRVLESLVSGHAPGRYGSSSKSLARRSDEATSALRSVLDTSGNEPLKRFVDGFDVNAPLLRSPLPTDGIVAGDEPASNEVKAIMVLEAEADIRSTEKELRDLEALDKRGLAGAGSLEGHEQLKPQLQQLRRDLPTVAKSYSALEDRLTMLLERYNHHVSTTSEIFILWNSLISQAEDAVARLEKAKNA